MNSGPLKEALGKNAVECFIELHFCVVLRQLDTPPAECRARQGFGRNTWRAQDYMKVQTPRIEDGYKAGILSEIVRIFMQILTMAEGQNERSATQFGMK